MPTNPNDCPILHEPMKVPVITSNGNTYEFSAIARCLLSDRPVDPLCSLDITSLTLNRIAVRDALILSLSDKEKSEIVELYHLLSRAHRNIALNAINSFQWFQTLLRSFIDNLSVNKRLQYAVEDGEIQSVTTLLADETIDVDQLMDDYVTLYSIAARYGRHEIINILLRDSHVLDPNQDREDGKTALMIAAENGHLNVVEALLGEGERVDPNLLDQAGNSALMIAAANGHLNVVEALLGADDRVDPNLVNDAGNSALMIAAANGHLNVVEALLGADDRVDPNLVNDAGNSALLMAVCEGYHAIIQLLLRYHNVNRNQRDASNSTALHIAAHLSRVDIVELFLRDQVLNPNLQDNEGCTPLLIASQKGYCDVVQSLASDSRVDLNLADGGGRTPFYRASYCGYFDIVEFFLANKSVDPNRESVEHKSSPLLVAVARNFHEVVRVMIEDERIDPNQSAKEGMGLLVFAATKGHEQVIKTLLLNEPVLNHFLKEMIQNPTLLRNQLLQYPILLTELSVHRDVIWEKVRHSEQANMSSADHSALLATICSSHDEKEPHPLRMLFETAPSLVLFKQRNIMEEVQAQVDASSLEAIQSKRLRFTKE